MRGREGILKCSGFVLKSNNVAIVEFEFSVRLSDVEFFILRSFAASRFHGSPKILEASASEITAGCFKNTKP